MLIDEEQVRGHADRMVRRSVDETLIVLSDVRLAQREQQTEPDA